MRWPSTRSWRWRGWGFGAGAVVGVGLKLVGELAGNGAFGKLGWVILVLSVAGGLALDRLNDRRRTREPTEDPVPPPNIPLPPPVDLLGRESAVRAVVDRLCRQGVALVHGAGGMGSSAVAIEAARQVVDDQDLQHYVDLRGQNPRKPDGARRVALRVLTTLGLDQGLSRNLDPVGRTVRDALRDSGRLLVIDNVTRVDQVGWLVDHVPGACLVVAGSVELATLPWPAESVDALDPEDALTLAARQDHDDHPGPSVAGRISADPAGARELAEKYLGQPGTAIAVGEWLVRNPTVTLRSMLEEFRDREPSGLASEIRGRLLDGASDDARTLLATLALVPARVLTESAVAALTDRDRRRTSDLLDELVGQRVVERLSPARYLVLDAAMSRGRDAGSPARGGPARLVRYYGRLAGDHARALSRAADPETTDRERRWFQSEDNTLTQLLAMNDPPREAAGDLWRIADALDTWFTTMDRTADRRDAAESMVHAAGLVGDLDARRAGHQRLIAICLTAGDIQAAEWHQAEARRLTDVEPDRAGCAFHTSQGLFFLADGQFEQAAWEFQQSLERRPDGDQSGRVVDLTNLGTVLLRQGRADAARRRLSDALAHAERAGDIAGQAHALELLGVVAQRQNDHRLARERWNASRSLHEQWHDNAGQARCLALEAAVLLDQNPDDDRAGTLLRRSLELRGGQDAGLGVALTHLRLGRLAARSGRTDQVRAHRDGGLAALRGWDRRLQEPPEVIAARDGLTAMDC